MDNKHDNDYVDVDYIENTDTKYIRGKPLYYKTSEVGEQLSESDSTVRFWCECFKDFLPIQTSGRNRMFKDGDIEKLKYIQKLLRKDHLTISQVKEYCSEEDTSIIERKIKESDPIALQSIASAMAIEIGSQLEEYKIQIKNEILNDIRQEFTEQNELQEKHHKETKEFIAITIEENIKDKFDIQLNNIKSVIDNMEQTTIKNITEKEDALKLSMEITRKESLVKKSWWSRLTNK